MTSETGEASGAHTGFDPPLFQLCQAPKQIAERVEVEPKIADLATRIEAALKSLAIATIQIRRRHRVWADDPTRNASNYVYHYTPAQTLDAVLPRLMKQKPVVPSSSPKTPKVLLSFVGSLNDPDEGEFFYDQVEKRASSLGLDEKVFRHLNSFRHAQPSERGLSSTDPLVYTASFCLEEDSLNLWRFYGGDACGVAFGAHISQFDTLSPEDAGSPVRNDISLDRKDRLYAVAYGEDAVRRTIEHMVTVIRPLEEVWSDLLEIDDNSSSALKGLQASLSNSVARILDTIAYLYKAEAYRAEQECRIVEIRSNDQINELGQKMVINGEDRPLSQTEILPISGVSHTFERSEIILGPRFGMDESNEGASDLPKTQMQVISRVGAYVRKFESALKPGCDPIVRFSGVSYR